MTRSWYREQPAVTQKATSLPNAVQMQKSTQKGGRQCAAGDAVGLFHGSPW